MTAEAEREVSAYVEIARRRMAEGDTEQAIEFFSRALSLDPERLEVHIDLAELEIARGKVTAALRRLEAVAEAYIDAGNTEAAADVIGFIEALQNPEEAGKVRCTQTGVTEPMGMLLPTPRHGPREETVLAKTILLFPDGTPMPTPTQSAGVAGNKRVTSPSRARFRVSPPPMLRRPR